MVVVVWVGLAGRASAYPVHRRLFKEAYGASTSCQLCHGYDGNTERNAYGEAWHRRGEDLDAFRAIEGVDSDRDGFANLAEIEAGSNPGDRESTPDNPTERWEASKSQLFIPIEQLELVFDDLSRIEAAEVELDDAEIAAVEEAVGATLDVEDRLPTLYFNVVRDRRRGVAVFHHLRDERGKYALLTAVARDGTASRVIIFRAPGEEGDLYIPYLRCLAGQPKDALPEPGEGDCPVIEGREAVQRAIRDEVRKVLYVVATHLAAQAAASEESAGDDAGAAAETDGGATGETALRFEAVEADGEASMMPASTATILVLLLIAFYLGAIWVAAGWAQRQKALARWPRLREMPGEVRLALSLIVLGLMLAQLVAITDAYVQTQVVSDSTFSYFQRLSEARLLGTSHSHLFGYTVTYGVLALLLSMSGASGRLKALVIAGLLLTGPFDILSWWGQKLYSPRFDWLTLTTGAVAGTASLVAALHVWRDALLGRGSDDDD